MAEFKWHDMADERPQNTDARYLLLGNGGGMYVGWISTLKYSDGSTLFRIPNRRSSFMGSEQVRAWAEIPEYEGE